MSVRQASPNTFEDGMPASKSRESSDSTDPDKPARRGSSASQPLRSFWMAGFEGADHVNAHGVPLDMVRASSHLDQLDQDYARVAAWGLRCVRESVGWRLSESRGTFDFTRARYFAQHARKHGLQVLWTLMHYGTPSDVSLLDDAFCERFAKFAAAAARELGELSDIAPIYTPINEISFLAWAATETNWLHPYGRADGGQASASSLNNGFVIKCRLVRAALMAMEAIREVDPRARFMHIEPVVHVVAPDEQPELAPLAEEVRSYQWQTWDLLTGELLPEIGGHPGALDLMGLNYYHSGQWEVVTERRLHWHLKDPRRRPLSRLLHEVWQRYRRPLVVAETSHFGIGRGAWLDEIGAEVQSARSMGVPLEGVCLYPIVDRPDWNDPAHWHHSGLWDAAPSATRGAWPRTLNRTYAKTLRRWQARLAVAA